MSYLEKAKRVRSQKPAAPTTLPATKKTNNTNKGSQAAQTVPGLVRSNLSDTLPRLPWQLERLISAASSGQLGIELCGVLDPSSYVMGWACSYLTGDRDEALKRLWQVYGVWREG